MGRHSLQQPCPLRIKKIPFYPGALILRIGRQEACACSSACKKPACHKTPGNKYVHNNNALKFINFFQVRFKKILTETPFLDK
jgi:hypothetical protein